MSIYLRTSWVDPQLHLHASSYPDRGTCLGHAMQCSQHEAQPLAGLSTDATV